MAASHSRQAEKAVIEEKDNAGRGAAACRLPLTSPQSYMLLPDQGDNVASTQWAVPRRRPNLQV